MGGGSWELQEQQEAGKSGGAPSSVAAEALGAARKVLRVALGAQPVACAAPVTHHEPSVVFLLKLSYAMLNRTWPTKHVASSQVTCLKIIGPCIYINCGADQAWRGGHTLIGRAKKCQHLVTAQY